MTLILPISIIVINVVLLYCYIKLTKKISNYNDKLSRFCSSLSHICIALIIQGIFGLFDQWLLGAFTMIGYFYSRERTQAQYTKKEKGQRTVDLWYVGIVPWQWTLMSFIDWILPTLAVLLVAYLN